MLILGAGYADVDRLSTGRFQYGPGLLDLYLRGNSPPEPLLIQLQRLFVLNDRILQQLFFGIQGARCEVIYGQISVHAQVDYRKIRGACLCLFPIRLNIAAYPTPHVGLIRQIKRQHEIIDSFAIADSRGAAVRRKLLTNRRWTCGDSRIIICAVIA